MIDQTATVLNKKMPMSPMDIQNNIWVKVIPRTNNSFMIISLLLVFGLDLSIAVSSPELLPFLYIMLVVIAVFAIFFYLENFVFRKKFANTTSTLDKWISMIIVTRNLIFLLNFIPFIQLLGLAAIVYLGWIIVLIYLGLMIGRYYQTKKEVFPQT